MLTLKRKVRMSRERDRTERGGSVFEYKLQVIYKVNEQVFNYDNYQPT